MPRKKSSPKDRVQKAGFGMISNGTDVAQWHEQLRW